MKNKSNTKHTFYAEEAEIAKDLVDNMHTKPDLSEKMCRIVIEQKRLFDGISLTILKSCATQLEMSAEKLLSEMAREKRDLDSDLLLRINLSVEKKQFLKESYQEIGRIPEDDELIFYHSKFVMMALMTHSFTFSQLIFSAVDQYASEETKQGLDKMAEKIVTEVIQEQSKANKSIKH
jgi:hypothetical protein